MIDPIAIKKGYFPQRSDKITQPGRIDSKIIDCLMKSDLVIADLTDQNPNVFYELAVRHALQKPVILVQQAGQKIPFDVSAQRVIRFDVKDLDSVDQAKVELESQIESVGIMSSLLILQ